MPGRLNMLALGEKVRLTEPDELLRNLDLASRDGNMHHRVIGFCICSLEGTLSESYRQPRTSSLEITNPRVFNFSSSSSCMQAAVQG